MRKTPGSEILGKTGTGEIAVAHGAEGVSRRAWLGGAALAIGAGAVFLAPLTARAGVSQADAKYQDKPQGDAKCGNCMQFKAPSSCQVVDGTISENGWCQFYSKKA